MPIGNITTVDLDGAFTSTTPNQYNPSGPQLLIPQETADDNVNFGLFNIHPLTSKGPLLQDLLIDRKLDFLCLTET